MVELELSMDDPTRQAILDELRRAALATYGEERVADWLMDAGLAEAATHVWRVTREALEPLDHEPLPTTP